MPTKAKSPKNQLVSPKAVSPKNKTTSSKVVSPKNKATTSKVVSPKNKSTTSSKPTSPKSKVVTPTNKTKTKVTSSPKNKVSSPKNKVTVTSVSKPSSTKSSVTKPGTPKQKTSLKEKKPIGTCLDLLAPVVIPPISIPIINMWESCVDPKTKHVYYYNSETKETSWTKPDGFQDEDENSQQRRKSAVVDDNDIFTSPENNEGGNNNDEKNQNPYFRDNRLSNPETPNPAVFEKDAELSELPSPLVKKSSVGFNVGSTVAAAQKFNKNLRANLGNEYASHQNEEQPRTRTRSWSGGGGSKSTKNKAPPATHVPVDALARAGERSNKWLEYIKKHLLMTEHVKDAGIFDLRNCARW